MRDIFDDEQRSYRAKSCLPGGLQGPPGEDIVAAPFRCPASPASPLLASPGGACNATHGTSTTGC